MRYTFLHRPMTKLSISGRSVVSSPHCSSKLSAVRISGLSRRLIIHSLGGLDCMRAVRYSSASFSAANICVANNFPMLSKTMSPSCTCNAEDAKRVPNVVLVPPMKLPASFASIPLLLRKRTKASSSLGSSSSPSRRSIRSRFSKTYVSSSSKLSPEIICSRSTSEGSGSRSTVEDNCSCSILEEESSRIALGGFFVVLPKITL
mmetsp:Transcript_26262/g.38933  ORF Transcript_26262/g.38933 Transcript_26262/m.38933 type:complete len:204 (+) Transcript_26262:220-831(+)